MARHSDEFEALCADAKTRVRELTVEQWRERSESLTLVDVREESEFAAGAMPGALHVGRGILERDALSHWSKETELVLYCGGGFRSALAADNLQRMGFTRVWSLAGGFKAWLATGA